VRLLTYVDLPIVGALADCVSFGFGGTNAHGILESFDDSTIDSTSNASPSATDFRRPFTPFIFSAISEISLKASIRAYAAYLKDTSLVACDARDLAFTLRERRSVFRYRVAFSSRSIEELKVTMGSILEDQTSTIGTKAHSRQDGQNGAPKIFGIFTGQGAQYPRMGASLVEESPLACRIVEELEAYLLQLPEADRPSWSLKSELLASSSRVHEAAISQTLCTAIQILLVDLLRIANVRFNVVIGHSSGEIAAAYAAGYLTARNAIVIAYYRGLQCRRAASPNGNEKGAMLAVGTSLEDASELCQDEWFVGRVCVAACNSPSSVTLSGDENAIQQLSVVLNDEKKFNRRLRVGQAYHSSHMLPCSGPYMASLRRANVESRIPPAEHRCYWYSSVRDGRRLCLNQRLDSTYWVENLTSPVLYDRALSAALLDNETPDMILEVGAHPALEGPSSDVIHHTIKQNVPYHGCLNRDMDAISAMSSCLGSMWAHMDSKFMDLNKYEIEVSGRGNCSFKLIKDLPSYQWDHRIKYWHESRRSQRMRLRKPSNQLLGSETPESAPYHLRWKNVLIPKEITWLEGHQVQGQMVFPAAGYISTAFEAARFLAAGREIQLIELSDFRIHQAITFDGENSAVEVFIELSDISENKSSGLQSRFTYAAALGDHTSDLKLVAEGKMRMILKLPSFEILPRRAPATAHLIDVTSDRLYDFMESLGYNFSGPFRSLHKLKRKLGKATCELSMLPANTSNKSSFLFHPAEIDAGFQSIMLAYSYPGDDKLQTLHLPASIAKIRVNPALCMGKKVEDKGLSVDSGLDPVTSESGFSGHVNFYASGYSNAALQVQGLTFIPFAGAVSEQRNVFYKMEWVVAAPDGASAAHGIPVTQQDTDLLYVLSRIASYFLRKFDCEVPVDSPARMKPPLCHYLNYAHHMTGLLRSGKHKYAKYEWLTDTFDDVMSNITSCGYVFSNDRSSTSIALCSQKIGNSKANFWVL
jgi:acyl transferase domain-containing protein